MSTRALIVVEGVFGDKMLFYRHSDGHPEVTGEKLLDFLDYVKEGRIRDNVSQSAGWLVVMGNKEYGVGDVPGDVSEGMGWKVGAFEPIIAIPSDTEFLYHIHLSDLILRYLPISGGTILQRGLDVILTRKDKSWRYLERK